MTVIGTVSLRDFDAGAVITAGGEIVNYEVDGVSRAAYGIPVPGVDGDGRIKNYVPCLFGNAEDKYQPNILPSFIFKRSSLTPAFERHPWVHTPGRKPAQGATLRTVQVGIDALGNPITVQGYDKYTWQSGAIPFDISYDVEVRGRLQADSLKMLHFLLRLYRAPWFVFKVFDTLGDERHYDAGELSISNTSELAGVGDRVISWTVSFTARAEFNLDEDVDIVTFSSLPQITLERIQI